MTRAIVISNGELWDRAVLRARLAEWIRSGVKAQVIAADGGNRHAAVLGLHVDVLIGDLDSLGEDVRAALEAGGTRFVAVSSHKDETDLELALLYAVEQGAREVLALGVLGDRLDMSLANILLLTHPALRDVRVVMWVGSQTAWIVRPPGDTISGQPGDTLSLLPLGGDARGITTHNLEYPLNDETLFFGPARGVSNVLAAPSAHLALREGLLLAVHTPGRA